MTKFLTCARKSVFDSTEAEPFKFWRQRDIEDFSNYPTVLQDSFYHRSNRLFYSQIPCILTLYGDYLVYRKVRDDFLGISITMM